MTTVYIAQSDAIFLWVGYFGGLVVFGCGYALVLYRKRWVLGGLLCLSGLSLVCYALFWPLLFGGYL